MSDFLINNNLSQYTNITEPIPSYSRFVSYVENILFETFIAKWRARVDSDIGPSGRGCNKLRFYRLVKSNFAVEKYYKIILPPRHRTAFSKFRCGVAPIRIETGRYESLAESLCFCLFCIF